MNVFEAVKDSVTTKDAAKMYGLTVGRNGMARCPFHNDKTPSMKVDRRFHCFGCQADGDVIDFTSRLFGVGLKDAAEKLATDFGIRYDGKARDSPKPVKRKVSEETKFRQAIHRCYLAYCDYLYLLRKWRADYAPRSLAEEWNPLFVEALQKQSYVEYLLDTLLSGTMEEQAELIAEHGKEVSALERRIREFTTAGQAGTVECCRSVER